MVKGTTKLAKNVCQNHFFKLRKHVLTSLHAILICKVTYILNIGGVVLYLVDLVTFNKTPLWFVIWFPSSCKSQSMLCVSLLAYAHHNEQKLWSWFSRLTGPLAHNAIWEHICSNQSHPINCRSHLYMKVVWQHDRKNVLSMN